MTSDFVKVINTDCGSMLMIRKENLIKIYKEEGGKT